MPSLFEQLSRIGLSLTDAERETVALLERRVRDYARHAKDDAAGELADQLSAVALPIVMDGTGVR